MLSRRYKIGRNRQQADLLPPSLEEYVSPTNVVRAIDAYVESLDLASLEFSNTKYMQIRLNYSVLHTKNVFQNHFSMNLNCKITKKTS